MKIGYARASTQDQAESIKNQTLQLEQHGCKKVLLILLLVIGVTALDYKQRWIMRETVTQLL